MRNLSHLDKYRVPCPFTGFMGDDYNGYFEIKLKTSILTFVVAASNNDGWDHVSISTRERCPRWNEMQQIKELFFEDDEVVMQLHPEKTEYINLAETCLHLWRPQNVEIPTPPPALVL